MRQCRLLRAFFQAAPHASTHASTGHASLILFNTCPIVCFWVLEFGSKFVNVQKHTSSQISCSRLTICITLTAVIWTALFELAAFRITATQSSPLEGFSTATLTWVFCHTQHHQLLTQQICTALLHFNKSTQGWTVKIFVLILLYLSVLRSKVFYYCELLKVWW